MWRTTQDGITAMVTAAGEASVGERREDALDALNAYIGTGITFKVIQTVGGSDVVRHARTHAGSMSRSGEELVLPSTNWTVGTNNAFDPADGPLRVVVHNTSDPTKYIEHDIGPGTTGTISDSFADTDTLALNCKITATNIDDPGSVPAPPAEFSYRIYDNPSVPVTVRPLVGMHFTNAANIASPGYDYDVFRTFDCPALAWSAIETSSGNYSWTNADAAINAAYGAGKRIVFVVHSPPAFHVSTGPYPDGDWDALDDFVDAVMARYAGKLWAVQWWSNPSRTTLLPEFAQGQVRTYRRVKAADPGVLVIFGGFRPSSGNTDADQDVIAMGTTAYDGTEARNAADIISFQSFGQTPSSEHALAVFRSMAATRAALRPALTLAMDMCGAHASFGGDFNESEHIQVIEQLLLLGVGFGAQLVGLYAHERQQEIGDPSSNANIRAAIDEIHGAISGKSMVRAYVLNDGAVWIAFSDGSTIQSPGSTYVPPEPDPEDPDRDLRIHPFAINDFANLKVGAGATYATTSDEATNSVRASVGLNGSVGPSAQNPTPAEWSIPRYVGTSSDPILNILVYAPGTSPSSGTLVSVRCPAGARPSRPWRPSDGHFSVINGNTIHEFWHVDPTQTPWHASSYTPAPLDGASHGYHIGFGGNHTIPGMLGWGSCRAYGGSANMGLIMPQELAAGLIPHVIGFAQREQQMSKENAPGQSVRWVWPATRDDGGGTYQAGVNGVRMGQVFAIPPSFDIDAQPWIPYVKTIARALRDYGAVCIDKSSQTCIYLELSNRTPEMFAITDSSIFRTQLNQAWSQLRRITNHTQATPKGNT